MRTQYPAMAAVATALLLTLAGPPAYAQQTVFDFDTPQADQTGSYTPDSGAELSGGVARLTIRGNPDWHAEAWPYRISVTITNPGTGTLYNHPVRIDFGGAPDALFDNARLDGADLLPVQVALAAEIAERWVESMDFISRSGVLWVKLPMLPPGDTWVQVYFGNLQWDQPGTAESLFSDPTGWASQCVVNTVAAQASLVVESFVDGNQISVVGGGSSGTLDTRDSTTIAAAELEMGTFIQGTGAFYGTFDGAGVDALVPIAFASTRFIAPAMRYEDQIDVVSPFGDATVTVYDNATLVTTQTVTAATPLTLLADVADGHVLRLESDLPVLAHHRGYDTPSTTHYDAYVMVPASTEIFGANSATTYLVAEQNGTLVDVWYSGGTQESFTLDASTVRTLSAAGSQGSGDAVHIIASAPVMAISQGDGDGGESITFLPARELGRRFLIPRAAEYVLVATQQPATTCRILDLGGAEVTSQQSGNYAPHYPNRLRFTNTAAGHELACDKPVWAMFEDSATNTERNLWPIKLHRPRVADEPTFALGSLEPMHLYDRGTVITPTYVAPYAVSQWTAFVETATAPAGSWLRYQLSDDGGQTWYWHDGDDWLAAAIDDQASPGWQVHVAMDQFPVDRNQLTVKAILNSLDGAMSPTLDDIQVFHTQVAAADQLVFGPVSSPQIAGQPFQITITATSSLGFRIQGYSEQATIQTLGGVTSPSTTPPFVNGQVTFEVAVQEAGPAVQLYAYQAAISGSSTPFEVIAADADRIEMVSGDQQFGMAGTLLPEPLVVRVITTEGNPAAGIDVTFVATDGLGTVGEADNEPVSQLVVTTDGVGEALVWWTLGLPPGAQRVEARLSGAGGSPVTFVARADPDPDNPYFDLHGEGGGCSCRTTSETYPVWPILWLIGLLLYARRRL